MTFSEWNSKYPNSWFSCQPGKNGFLPVQSPLKKLPEKYQIINDLLDEMKITQSDGSTGLLGKNKFAEELVKRLPLFDFSDETNVQLLATLQRDYTFMAAAYSLETSHYYLKDGVYGEAREDIPSVLAIPLKQLGEKNDVFPWLDYAYGYGLNNACLKEGADPTKQESYDTVRMFNGHESESGFINVHVAIDYQSGDLLAYQQDILKNLDDRNMEGFVQALSNHATIFENMVSSLKTMWKSSDLNDYLSFRTFIMGQKGNKVCYPNERLNFLLNNNGTETETETETENEFHSYRGETGAQDSIIPSVDNLLSLEYPKNKLTEYLFQLRNYRPKDHQAYIEYNLEQSKNLGLKDFAKQSSNASFQLLRNLESLRAFRSTHWNLTKSYIIKNTKHPVATGGTPITTWLPNQLGATLDYMSEIVEIVDIKELNENDAVIFSKIVTDLDNQKEFIFNEVSKLQEDFTHEDAI